MVTGLKPMDRRGVGFADFPALAPYKKIASWWREGQKVVFSFYSQTWRVIFKNYCEKASVSNIRYAWAKVYRKPHCTMYSYIYIIQYTYHSVCPFVGIGTAHHLSRKRVCPPPPEPKGGGPGGTHSPACEGVGDDWRKKLALCLLCAANQPFPSGLSLKKYFASSSAWRGLSWGSVQRSYCSIIEPCRILLEVFSLYCVMRICGRIHRSMTGG